MYVIHQICDVVSLHDVMCTSYKIHTRICICNTQHHFYVYTFDIYLIYIRINVLHIHIRVCILYDVHTNMWCSLIAWRPYLAWCTHTYMQYIYTYINQVYIKCIHVKMVLCAFMQCLGIWLHVYICIYTFIYTNTHKYINMCMYICTYTYYMYIHIPRTPLARTLGAKESCIYIHIYIHIYKCAWKAMQSVAKTHRMP